MSRANPFFLLYPTVRASGIRWLGRDRPKFGPACQRLALLFLLTEFRQSLSTTRVGPFPRSGSSIGEDPTGYPTMTPSLSSGRPRILRHFGQV